MIAMTTHCLIADNFRPYLTSYQGQLDTDFINAVFVDVSSPTIGVLYLLTLRHIFQKYVHFHIDLQGVQELHHYRMAPCKYSQFLLVSHL